MKDRGWGSIFCYCCGELYCLRDFSRESPLEVCGECGAEYFIKYSEICLEGYLCLEHYQGLIGLLPEHLQESLPQHLCPQPANFSP